ncbi:MAG: imidazolonepropionase [Gammaproteobacteria bacterium]|nr:imidazolonepropionase [Gammaproteobacteria bacterium]NNF48834.1 imidazolonepropionase [Woeseiaceae bacterium]MBT8093804.1 imidazolonepropionase [Gammaproteobacteria bacterium]MBT8105888.1 imidazolonepropionase [Gammaproteobacteria bacterium]NNK25902.1 imidazolonepropionase [Woeseiaceae bacterium]
MDLLLTDARIATMTGPGYGVIEDGAIAIEGENIAWVGPQSEVPDLAADESRSVDGRWITPALIDCHTHLVFAGDRSGEFEQRQGGASYEDIARAGGGIMSTVHATREASADALYASALERIHALMAEGVATVEIKSGYGLDIETELKMLKVARRLGDAVPVTVCTTLLAAHAVPPEFADDVDGYVDLICNELLPEVVAGRLADAVDAYCESIAFDAGQVESIFSRAHELGLPVKLHADQLSDGGGARLAAAFGALSADHLEYTPAAAVETLAESGTVAVLLPGAFVTLGETRRPPVAALRANGVPIAVATDCNPGTSPICSLHAAMMLAARQFRLTPEECFAGVTHAAAQALGLPDRGTLAKGKRADIAIWDFAHPRELAYWFGTPRLAELLLGGQTTAR